MCARGRVLSLTTATLLGAAACSGHTKECAPFQVREIDEAGPCLGPPVVADGLFVCDDPTALQGEGETERCFVDPSGRVFRGFLSSTEWLEPATGAGWKSTALFPGGAGVLSPDEEARCSPAFDLWTPTCQ
jgi:hypothetical protein